MSRPLYCETETYSLRLRETMILPQMAVGLHAQGTAVFMSEPARDSRNIYAALDANRRENMTKIMVRNPFHPDLRSCVRHAVLAFEHSHYG